MRTKLILAAALVTGAAGIALMTTASNAGPIIKLNVTCWPQFAVNGNAGSSTYGCSKIFYALCKKGYSANKPTLVHLGGNKYRIQYGCYLPPH